MKNLYCFLNLSLGLEVKDVEGRKSIANESYLKNILAVIKCLYHVKLNRIKQEKKLVKSFMKRVK